MRWWAVLLAVGGCYPWVDTELHSENTGDCAWYEDADGDGFGDAQSKPLLRCDDPGGDRVQNGGDCDDAYPLRYPGAPELCDGVANDCADSAPPADEIDGDGDGFVACDEPVDWRGPQEVLGGGDCDEEDPLVRPGLPERCDGADNDCDGDTDEGLKSFDVDGDGHYDASCGGDDCNDLDATVFPEAPEVCGNDRDDDCDPDTRDDDADGDGHWPLDCFGGDDCDDSDESIHPGARDDCDDGVDSDCSGLVDDLDEDGDGVTVCGGIDCDDADDTVGPGATEVCGNTVDEDCSGRLDDLDVDRDGAFACGGADHDCDDNDPAISPLRPEDCSTIGVDDDCSGAADDLDADFDGHISEACAGNDCDDSRTDIHDGQVELCDGLDNDCNDVRDDRDIDGDAVIDEACVLYDGALPNDDCDDRNPYTHPGADELEDELDNDCDDDIDEGTALYDDDGDGYCEAAECSDGSLGGDCDDDDFFRNPGEHDDCDDGYDNDCDPTTGEQTDGDGDGYAACDGDCDDRNGAVGPGAAEQCGDTVDSNCDGDPDADCATCAVTLSPGASIQTALEGVLDGQIVCLASGTYDANIDWVGTNRAVLGLEGPSRVTLEAELSSDPVVTFATGSTARLEGVMLTGAGSAAAAAVVVDAGSSPTFADVWVQDNATAGLSLLEAAADVTLDRVWIFDNDDSGVIGEIRIARCVAGASGRQRQDRDRVVHHRHRQDERRGDP